MLALQVELLHYATMLASTNTNSKVNGACAALKELHKLKAE